MSGKIVIVGGGRRRPLLRLLPAQARRGRHDRRVKPDRLGRLVRKRRLAVPGAGGAAARAGPHALRDARAVRPRLRALLQAGRLAPARAVAAALLDVLQRARPRPRHRGDRAARPATCSTSSRRCSADGVEFELHKQGMVVRRPQRRRRPRRARTSSRRCATSATSCPTTCSPTSELHELEPALSRRGRPPASSIAPALARAVRHLHRRARRRPAPRRRRDPGGRRGRSSSCARAAG